jgi:AcrR family transcriptional regulator
VATEKDPAAVPAATGKDPAAAVPTATGKDPAAAVPALVWERGRRPRRRPAPGEDQIAAAAVAIADAEGLAAVTMRRLAGELGTGTTSLYRYVADKDELLERMVDSAYAEEPGSAIPTGDWRADLRAVALATLATMLRHPWLAAEQLTRPAFGPNALARMELAWAAAAGLTSDATLANGALTALLDYVAGAAGRQLGEREAQRRSGLSQDQWRATVAPYLRSVVASNKYPHLARRITDAAELSFGEQFEFGLDCLLDGISARVATGG